MYRKLVSGLFILFLYSLTYSQDVKVKGYFIEDTIKIGISSPFVLTATYPRALNVVFPDSLYDYSPYELGEKFFVPTSSNDSISYDSAIYYLTSFEIDSTQFMQLPVYQLTGNDSIEYLSNTDSIILEHLVNEIPDSLAVEALPLIENTTYRYVELALNYPYLVAGGLILLLALIISYFLFGKSIRKWFKLKRMKKRHEVFINAYNSLLSNANENIEAITQLWKQYHEKLDKQPFTKMTTKELLKLDYVQKVETELKAVDRAIYGGKSLNDENVFQELLRFTENRYADKVNEIKYE